MRSRVSLGQRLPLPVEGPGAQVPTLVRHGTRSTNKIYRSQESPMQSLMFHSVGCHKFLLVQLREQHNMLEHVFLCILCNSTTHTSVFY